MNIPRFLVWFVVFSIVVLGLSWLLLDEKMTQLVSDWGDKPLSKSLYSVLVISVLSVDLLLPIPSSAVITHAGQELGVVIGTVITLIGLTAGSCVGYGVARVLGNGYVANSVSESDREALQNLIEKNGVLVLVLLRPVPILAEASVLLVGLGKMSWWRFFSWLTISNFAICLFFAKWGVWASENDVPEFASLLISIAFPLILLFVSKLLIPKIVTSESKQSNP